MPPQSTEYPSTLGIKIHKSRGDHLKVSGDIWLKEKGEDDGAEGLWRIHDDIYDFTDFVDRHPGGAMWLQLTKGTDISEAFESHHVTLSPERMLSKFQVRKATTKRNSPFTFKEDGFYRTLKKEVREKLKTIPDSAATKSKLTTDLLLISFVLTALLAAKYMNYWIGTLSGMCLAMVTIAAHNFFHQKDSFRMFYFDLSTMSSREWRISHALSHHLYTNTIIDMEIQLFEPLFQFLPMKKSFFFKYGSWIYAPVFYMTIFLITLLRRITNVLKGNYHEEGKRFMIPFIIPILMTIFGGQSLINSFMLWIWIVCVASFQFALIGINAGHQRVDVFHDGDTPRAKSIDWGIFQLDATMDRTDVTGSPLLVLTTFGDHALHHLFPTVDHGKLEYLYPVFKEVCDKFGVNLRMDSQLNMLKETYIALANETPNPFPPGQKQT